MVIDCKPSVENILSVYRRATLSDLEMGMSWYSDALDFATSLDPIYPERAAGIIAALSPLQHWEVNKAMAAKIFANASVDGIGLFRNASKAWDIYNYADPMDVLGGNKVRAFYLSICNPFDSDIPPVIDRHAYDIAVGMVTDDKSRATLSRKGRYDEFADAYCEAAAIVGISSSQLQAITWTTWREEL